MFNAMGQANADKIADFRHNTDKIALEDWLFAAIGPSLDKGEFYAKAGAKAAHDADDRIVYNKTNGNLYYDADGKGWRALKEHVDGSILSTAVAGGFIGATVGPFARSERPVQ